MCRAYPKIAVRIQELQFYVVFQKSKNAHANAHTVYDSHWERLRRVSINILYEITKLKKRGIYCVAPRPHADT